MSQTSKDLKALKVHFKQDLAEFFSKVTGRPRFKCVKYPNGKYFVLFRPSAFALGYRYCTFDQWDDTPVLWLEKYLSADIGVDTIIEAIDIVIKYFEDEERDKRDSAELIFAADTINELKEARGIIAENEEK